MAVEQTGMDVDKLSFLPIAGGAAVAALAWEMSRRLPRKVETSAPDVQGWRIFVGKTFRGRRIYVDFDSIPHFKIGGITGSGKTKLLELLLGQIIATKTADEAEVYIIDMKGGASFPQFARCPQVRKICASIPEAVAVTEDVKRRMEERLVVIARERAAFRRIPRFPRIILIIDEGGELAPVNAFTKEDEADRRRFMSALSSITRIGREPCVTAIYGTQRPSNETLPVGIRGQMDGTFAYRTQNEQDSQIILRNDHAYNIRPVKGRMIMQTPGFETDVQTAYIRDDVLQQWIVRASMDVQDTWAGSASSLSAFDFVGSLGL